MMTEEDKMEKASLQTKTVLKIFADIYGIPSWQKNPKDGQDVSKIIKLWNETLHGYSLAQVEEAAFRIVRQQKSMRFPTISHVRAQLFDKSKEEDIKQQIAEIEKKLREPREETDPIRKRMCSFYVGGHKVLPGVYEWAAKQVLNDVERAYPELKFSSYGPLVRKAEELGWLDSGKIIDYCKEIGGYND